MTTDAAMLFAEIDQRVLGTLRLEACPECGYSLEGLRESGQCPECGFVYDEFTVVVEGIPCGMSGMPGHRRVLWLILAGMLWLGPSFGIIVLIPLMQTLDTAGTIAAVVGMLAAPVVLATYLIRSGQRESRESKQQIIVTAGGFGRVVHGEAAEANIALTPWSRITHVLLKEINPNYHRLKLVDRSVALLELNLACDREQSHAIKRLIELRLRDSR